MGERQNQMPAPIISVENLSKRYLIGHEDIQRRCTSALRDVIGREARNFVRKAVNWALRNIGKRNKRLNREAIASAERSSNGPASTDSAVNSARSSGSSMS